MKIIKPHVELINPIQNDYVSFLKHIEKCGRTCYKSEDKITDDSYVNFIKTLKSKTHLSVFEHGTIYVVIPKKELVSLIDNKYSCIIEKNDNYYITTNFRVIIENQLEYLLNFIVDYPTQYHEKRFTFKIVTSIGITRELNRHRTFSISEESTRYCNYSKDRFNNEITFVQPKWCVNDLSGEYVSELSIIKNTPVNGYGDGEEEFLRNLIQIETCYFNLLKSGLIPQDAREILPLTTKTEAVYTGFEKDWKHFLKLRSSKAGASGQHPNINIVANEIYDILMKNGQL